MGRIMTKYIDIYDVEIDKDNVYIGSLYLRKDKIEIEAVDKRNKDFFEQVLGKWKVNYLDRGLTDDTKVFEMIPIIVNSQ
jgi:hypothetical protein